MFIMRRMTTESLHGVSAAASCFGARMVREVHFLSTMTLQLNQHIIRTIDEVLAKLPPARSYSIAVLRMPAKPDHDADAARLSVGAMSDSIGNC